MLQAALQKLHKEIAEQPNNDYVRFVGGELMKYVREHPDQAELFTAEGKSIASSLDELRKVAEGRKNGGMAVIAPDEGMKIVLTHFGIEVKKPVPAPAVVGFNIDLDALL